MSNLKPYPKYKSSGVEWLGDVPEDWDIVPVKKIACIINGYPFDSKKFEIDGKYPLVRIRDLGSSATKTKFNGTFVEDASINSSDVLIGMDGDFNVGHWQGRGKALLNQRMCCVRGINSLITKYIEYILPTPLKLINDITYATTVKHLASSQVEKVWLAMPVTESELKKVCLFLDQETTHIDSLVEEKTRFIDLLKEKQQALITQAVTKGLDPNVKMKGSGVEWVGDVPEHWAVKKIGALYRETADSGNEELPVLSISIHHGASKGELKGDKLERKVTRIEDKTKYKRVYSGDLVYNMMRAWQGGFGTISVSGLVSPAYVVARPLKENISSQFIEYLLRTSNAIEEMHRLSHGITDFRLRLYWEKFKTMNVILPANAEQQNILNFISRETAHIDSLVCEVKKSIELLKERRAALITAAVTGKIDVRNH